MRKHGKDYDTLSREMIDKSVYHCKLRVYKMTSDMKHWKKEYDSELTQILLDKPKRCKDEHGKFT